ncbi:energy transducer TonB [Spectribacter hydrogenoxidans]|uniref:Energy transducer TonB n=1 Tax=Spectribacter hydrogenoxidans TaxID=3075608 RepID=A0ABU3C0V2_9GAMM|nr:energy transducer TonB [Salinisphaera sp. W335]MDT0635168.1 energy transducer TonB [Salinisphaera sp. W335]
MTALPLRRHWLGAALLAALLHAGIAALIMALVPTSPSALVPSEQGVAINLESLGDAMSTAPAPAPESVEAVEPDMPAPDVAEVPTRDNSVPEAEEQDVLAATAADRATAETADPTAPTETVEALTITPDAPPTPESSETARGGGDPTEAYIDTVRGWLSDNKQYPEQARQRGDEGVVRIYFVVDREGNILEYRILESSGIALLDREVEALLDRAQPLPAMPDDLRRNRIELVVPIEFSLN